MPSKAANLLRHLQLKRDTLLLLLVTLLVLIAPVTRAQSNDEALLFLSNRSGEWRLYTLSRSTGDIAPWAWNNVLSEYKVRYANLSADSTKLAFVATDYLPNGDFFDDIFWLDLLTGQVTRITTNTRRDSGYPVWSPDTTKLAYLSEGVNGDFAELHIYNPSTGQDQLVTTAFIGQRPDGSYIAVGNFRGLDWATDSQQLAIWIISPLDEFLTSNNLVLMNTDGANIRTIAFPHQADLANPQWHIDASTIYAACTLNNNPYDSICKVNPQNHELTRLVDLDRAAIDDAKSHYIGTLNVLPDGQMTFNLVSENDFFVFDPASGHITRLPTNSRKGTINILLGPIDLALVPSPPSSTTNTATNTTTVIPTPTKRP